MQASSKSGEISSDRTPAEFLIEQWDTDKDKMLSYDELETWETGLIWFWFFGFFISNFDGLQKNAFRKGTTCKDTHAYTLARAREKRQANRPSWPYEEHAPPKKWMLWYWNFLEMFICVMLTYLDNCPADLNISVTPVGHKGTLFCTLYWSCSSFADSCGQVTYVVNSITSTWVRW